MPTLYLIGDSTVNNHTRGLLGWGDPIKALFDSSRIRVENRARGGRSSRTYLTEGLWRQAASELKPGDFVLMQFGHNDGGPLVGGRARASLKGNGEESREVVGADGKPEVVHTYGWYLRRYISDSKASGAVPIVLSPIPRNIWVDDHHVARNSKDYGKWAKEAAREGGAHYVDLNGIIAGVYDRLGHEAVLARYFTEADHTHSTPAGAEVNAQCVAEGIRKLRHCSLRDYLLPGRRLE